MQRWIDRHPVEARKQHLTAQLRWQKNHPEENKATRARVDQKRKHDPARKAGSLQRLEKWAAANPKKVRVAHALKQSERRARVEAGSVTREEWEEQLEVFGNCCAYCENVVPACPDCNQFKYNRGPLHMLNR